MLALVVRGVGAVVQVVEEEVGGPGLVILCENQRRMRWGGCVVRL